MTNTICALDEKTAALLPELCSKYGVMADDLDGLLSALEAKVDFPFVHGRGKRKSQLQRDIELLRGLSERKQHLLNGSPVKKEYCCA